MFSTIALTTALFIPAAPAPKDAPRDAASGLAPRVVELKPDADGKVRVLVSKPGNIQGKMAISIVVAGPNGAPNVPPIPQNIVVQGGPSTTEKVDLASVKDLTVCTAGGKELTREDALKSLAKGGVVIISNDGKKVSPVFLKAFKDDVLVLVAPDLANQSQPRNMNMQGGGANVTPAVPLQQPAPELEKRKE